MPVIVGNRLVFPLQKAFCEALAGRDAVWALSTLPSLSLFSFMDVGSFGCFCDAGFGQLLDRGWCFLFLDLALVSVCVLVSPLSPPGWAFHSVTYAPFNHVVHSQLGAAV